ncbi:MAG: sialate O-acetylesterase [Phycisphaerae bacterium]|nr:sialate O-acetylesterase [Phycisphaerae bacterium]
MNIQSGLSDGMVLQRTKRDVCDVVFQGRADAAGALEARVTTRGKLVRGFHWIRVGRVRKKKLQGRLRGLKVGGPYDIRLRVVGRDGSVPDAGVVKNVLVGDVWILAGQSNMEGIGRLPGLKAKPHVRAFYMDDVWRPAEDRIHNLHQAVAPVHAERCGGVRPVRSVYVGVGPGVSFGQAMEKHNGVPQGLIACAHGGTRMDEWDPKKKRLGGHSLYGATLARFEKNGGRVAGVVWYQGCSDANADAATLYTQRMKALVAAFRRDLRDARLPFVLVQIAGVVRLDDSQRRNWNSIQDQQRRLPDAIDRCLCVPAIDLELDDQIHIDAPGQHRLGRRLAEAMCALTKRGTKPLRPIQFKGWRIFRERGFGTASIEVKFANVAGALRSGSKPAGFALSDWADQPKDAIFKILPRGNRVILRTPLQEWELEGMRLHYGFGLNPYVNITDERDRSLPVFGPIPLGTPQFVTPFVRTLRVSKILPSAGKLQTLACPDTKDRKLGWSRRTFPAEFCSRRQEFLERATEDVLVHYACKFDCPEATRLELQLGYDGPVKVWLDGKKVFHDPSGTNPAAPTDACLKLSLTAGKHELVVSLGSNHGRAWGIFLRFKSHSISSARVAQGNRKNFLPLILS